MDRQLFSGAAKACITPPAELLPDLLTFGGRYHFSKIHDDIYVRIIVFGDGVSEAMVVAYDLDKAPYPDEWMQELEKRTGVPYDNILYVGQHTHTAPFVGKRSSETAGKMRAEHPEKFVVTDKYETFLHGQLMDAAEEAVTSMRPAVMGYAYGESFVNINREQEYETYIGGERRTNWQHGFNGHGPVDHTLFMMRVNDLNGKPIAFLTNFSMHCVAMIWNLDRDGKMWLSGDIAGNVSQLMEKEFKGTVAVWTSGAAGDIDPIMDNEIYYPDPETGRYSVVLAGSEMASVMLHLMVTRLYDDMRRTERRIVCDKDKTYIASAIDFAEAPLGEIILDENGGYHTIVNKDAGMFKIRVHAIRIGDLGFVGIDGELLQSLGWEIQKASPMTHTLVFNHDASLMLEHPDNYIRDDYTLIRQRMAIKEAPRYDRGDHATLPGYIAPALRASTIKVFTKVL